MTNRYFYQADIATFLAEDTNSIFGKMSRAQKPRFRQVATC